MFNIGKLIDLNLRMVFNKKYMQLNFGLLTLLCMLTFVSHAQNDPTPSLNIGDKAPPMRLHKWIKGTPVQEFEKGMIYVIEFWATWCIPCKAAMPHLSALSVKYKDIVTVVGIDILENKIKNSSIEKTKKFVDSMGLRMNYAVAIQDSNFMETDWYLPAGGGKNIGIPSSFVVNRDGRLAWVGHPKDLEKVLPKIVNNTWDIKEELNKRNLAQRLRELDDSLSNELWKYREDDRIKPGKKGRPDSALLAINKIIKTEPRLTYAPLIAYTTFESLLKTNQHKALEYGRIVIVTPSYDDEPAYDIIIGVIKTYSTKLTISAEIYQLGAEAYQVKIDATPYPEIMDMYKYYHKMAEWYWRAKNKMKSIEAEQKAIVELKNETVFSKTMLAEYELALKKYTKNLK
jgi:thiol-disulfide isomerase/thioredoxin